MAATDKKYPRSVTALLHRSERNERGRARKEAYQRQWRQEREQLLLENERLRRENVSALKLLLRMTRRYELLRGYIETLRNWIAAQRGHEKPSESGHDI